MESCERHEAHKCANRAIRSNRFSFAEKKWESLTCVLITVKARVHKPGKIASTCTYRPTNLPICQYASATIIYRSAYVSWDSISSLLIASPLQISMWARIIPIQTTHRSCMRALSKWRIYMWIFRNVYLSQIGRSTTSFCNASLRTCAFVKMSIYCELTVTTTSPRKRRSKREKEKKGERTLSLLQIKLIVADIARN